MLPEVDPATRALKVRLVANNPGYKLRPDMFVNVEMPVSIPPGLSVPADAIVDTGLAKQVSCKPLPVISRSGKWKSDGASTTAFRS